MTIYTDTTSMVEDFVSQGDSPFAGPVENNGEGGADFKLKFDAISMDRRTGDKIQLDFMYKGKPVYHALFPICKETKIDCKGYLNLTLTGLH